jgi:predicted nucleotidyltransferase
MKNTAVFRAIKKTVQSHLPGSRVLLFGSRARGSNDRDSDYDLLIITPTTYTFKEKANLSTRLDHAIVRDVKIPVDLLINSEEEILQKQMLPGHILRSAMKEGVFL